MLVATYECSLSWLRMANVDIDGAEAQPVSVQETSHPRLPSNVLVRPSSLRKPILPDEVRPAKAVVLVGVHHRPGVVERTDKELRVVELAEGHQRTTATVGGQ